MKHRITRSVGAVAVMITAGVHSAFADRFTCFVIRSGDTAASLALQLTGDAAHRREPWFQIVDPAASRFIPKAEYRRIFPGWHVCVAEGRANTGSIAVQARPQELGPRRQPPSVEIVRTTRFIAVWLGGLLILVTPLAWRVATSYSNGRRTTLNIMTSFGNQFIREFEQPLMRPGSNNRALESRLRFKPRRRQLDILLAPHDGRTYPNLSDHRMNVQYDVGRVLRRLRDDRFVGERLLVRGRWVIVRCRLRTDAEVGGDK